MSKSKKLPIYLNDSSDEELSEVESNIQYTTIQDKEQLYLISATLGKKSQELLTNPQVKITYAQTKNALHNRVFQEDKQLLNILPSQWILGKYLGDNNSGSLDKFWQFIGKQLKNQSTKVNNIFSWLEQELKIFKLYSDYAETTSQTLVKSEQKNYANIVNKNTELMGLEIHQKDLDKTLKELFEKYIILAKGQDSGPVIKGQQTLKSFLIKTSNKIVNITETIDSVLKLYKQGEDIQKLLNCITNKQLKLEKGITALKLQQEIDKSIQKFYKIKLQEIYKNNPSLFYDHLVANKLQTLLETSDIPVKKIQREVQDKQVIEKEQSTEQIFITNTSQYNQKDLNEILNWYTNTDKALATARQTFIKNYTSFTQQLDVNNLQAQKYVKSCIQYINSKNQSIAAKLWHNKPEYVFKPDPIERFVDFKLYHRIVKAHLKTNGILKQEDKKARDVKFFDDEYFSTSEELKIYVGGTRGDLRNLPGNDYDSYTGIAQHLKEHIIRDNFTDQNLVSALKLIIKGQKIDLSIDNFDRAEYIHRLADLLFNCEPERNVSAFLTNAMFFDLVAGGKYKIEDLPNKMPMAMKGAIEASRMIWNILGGEYGAKGSRQHFDYKIVDSKDWSTNMQCIELLVKEGALLYDWLTYKSNDQVAQKLNIDNIIKVTCSINKLLASKYFKEWNEKININQESFFLNPEQLVDSMSQYDVDIKTEYSKIQKSEGSDKKKFKAFKVLINSQLKTIETNITIQLVEKALKNIVDKVVQYIDNTSINNLINQLIQEWYEIKLVESSGEDTKMKIELNISDPMINMSNKMVINEIFDSKDKHTNVVISTAEVNTILKIIKNYPEGAFAENTIKPTIIGGIKSWQTGWYSELMILLLLEACNPNCLVVTDTVNTINVNHILKALKNKLSLLNEGELKNALLEINQGGISLDNKLKKIKLLLESSFNYFKDLFYLDLEKIDTVSNIYGQLPNIIGECKNKAEFIKNFKQTSPEYDLYQMTNKEFLSDKITNFLSLTDKKHMVIPINIASIHWTAFVINKDDKTVYYIDAQGNKVGTEAINKVSQEIAIALGVLKLNINYVFEKQVQFDGYNCGPFMIEAVSRIINDKIEALKDFKNIKIVSDSKKLGEDIRTTHQKLLEDKVISQAIFEKIIKQSDYKLSEPEIEIKNSKVSDSTAVSELWEKFQKLSEEQQEIFKQLFTLSGLDTENTADIGWINESFGKYTLDRLDNILYLRLKALKLKDIKTLQGIFVDQKQNNIAELLSEIINTKAQTTLVPLDLFNKHAAGLIFEKNKDNSIQVKYLDSENKPIPVELEQIFNKYHLNIKPLTVEKQKYANCGPEVIENFILYLTGKRVSQEKAIELHSKLVENSLLNVESSSGIHLSFEESANNYLYTEDYQKQSQDYNNLFYNFDYDNPQHVEVAGDVSSFH